MRRVSTVLLTVGAMSGYALSGAALSYKEIKYTMLYFVLASAFGFWAFMRLIASLKLDDLSLGEVYDTLGASAFTDGRHMFTVAVKNSAGEVFVVKLERVPPKRFVVKGVDGRPTFLERAPS